MTRHLRSAAAVSLVLLGATAALGADWIFAPSRYSHDPATGERVVQYEAPPPARIPNDPTYVESGYRHRRSGLQVGGSYDYQHIVETWGEGELIRPYGEWLYPYRAGATPFGPWGNPQGPWTLPFDSWVNPYGAWNKYGYPYGYAPLYDGAIYGGGAGGYAPPAAPLAPSGPGYGGPRGPAYRAPAAPLPAPNLHAVPQVGPGPHEF